MRHWLQFLPSPPPAELVTIADSAMAAQDRAHEAWLEAEALDEDLELRAVCFYSEDQIMLAKAKAARAY